MILVTGASGFLGGAIARSLGDQAIGIGRKAPENTKSASYVATDLAKPSATAGLIAQLREKHITQVVHAAAVTPWGKSADFAEDMQIAQSLVMLCNSLGVEALYLLSGWIVYDTHAPVPFQEDSPINPDTPYGKSKAALEEFFGKQLNKTRPVSLRLSSVYGPGQTSPGLVPNLVQAALAGKEIRLGAKETKRDYLYIDDLVGAVQVVLHSNSRVQGAINLGSGQVVSILQVGQIVQKLSKQLYDIEVPLTFEPELKEAELLDNTLAIEKAHNLGLLYETTPFETGLKAYMEWSHSYEAIL